MKLLIKKNNFLDKPVWSNQGCKCDVDLPKDSRAFLRLAGVKHLNVTINDRKGDCKVIFMMMDNLGLHEVPNGYQQSDGVPSSQRESFRSTTRTGKLNSKIRNVFGYLFKILKCCVHTKSVAMAASASSERPKFAPTQPIA